MRIVVTAEGAELDAPASPIFGRCAYYLFVDTATMQWEAVENPARASSGGAGIQAAQFIIEKGARAVVAGEVGPNAMDVFAAAGLPVYTVSDGTVREAVAAFQSGKLPPAQAGGRGYGKGGGRMAAGVPVPPAAAGPSRADRIAELEKTASALRQQLAQLMDEIERLSEKE